MTLDTFKTYCLSKKGVEETYPFKGEAVWMKVMGKMFAMTFVREFTFDKEIAPPFHFINLKCDPERAEILRTKHAAIQPGWHQSKKHWNSVFMDGSLSDDMIKELIDHSYDIVCESLPKKDLEILNTL
ncbi:MmcQ/YjbR family DNA-binding protein [Fulvivirgaceae bacterium BMA10]|uniref:MmcQ/YjbR family DNA-binding protein n=1 Tax=Splendidivirga corallicola TaxID=3051826 RepID=A0ABT8KV64_9BACT|nr:MmcQ/YjbR family DNA-binding protein [Fulvivirgaceae bacterium BMA10]